MASIYNLKPAFQNLLRPISNWLAKHSITPNIITLSALILSFVTGLGILFFPDTQWIFILVPIVLLVRMILNALDGMIAREYNLQSSLGVYLNELGDVFSDIFIYLPFSIVLGIAPVLIISIVLLSVISEMAGILGLQISGQRRYDGPMGKSDRAFIFGFVSLLIGLGIQAYWLVNLIFIVVNLLLIVTIFNRITRALKVSPT